MCKIHQIREVYSVSYDPHAEEDRIKEEGRPETLDYRVYFVDNSGKKDFYKMDVQEIQDNIGASGTRYIYTYGGVGFKAKAESKGRLLLLKLGYSHRFDLTLPPAVRLFCFKENIVCCTSIDKQRVHQIAAAVRSCKLPGVYKGNDIMYVDEVNKKKQCKKSK